MVGFIVGVLSGIVASLIIRLIFDVIPMSVFKYYLKLMINPYVYGEVIFNQKYRMANRLILKLFKAWEQKDLESYLECWDKDAVKIKGVDGDVNYTILDIEKKFAKSIIKYSSIRAKVVLVDDIMEYKKIQAVIVVVSYRFYLIREDDGIPVIEDAREAYTIKMIDGKYKIVRNIDYYKDVE